MMLPYVPIYAHLPLAYTQFLLTIIGKEYNFFPQNYNFTEIKIIKSTSTYKCSHNLHERGSYSNNVLNEPFFFFIFYF